jgi:hypothetical protein
MRYHPKESAQKRQFPKNRGCHVIGLWHNWTRHKPALIAAIGRLGALCRLQEGQPDPEKEAAKVEKIKALAQDPDLYNRLIKAIGASDTDTPRVDSLSPL